MANIIHYRNFAGEIHNIPFDRIRNFEEHDYLHRYRIEIETSNSARVWWCMLDPSTNRDFVEYNGKVYNGNGFKTLELVLKNEETEQALEAL